MPDPPDDLLPYRAPAGLPSVNDALAAVLPRIAPRDRPQFARGFRAGYDLVERFTRSRLEAAERERERHILSVEALCRQIGWLRTELSRLVDRE